MLTSETIELTQRRTVPPIWLTATDAAIALALEGEDIDALTAAGEITFVRLDGRIRIAYDSLQTYAKKVEREQRETR